METFEFLFNPLVKESHACPGCGAVVRERFGGRFNAALSLAAVTGISVLFRLGVKDSILSLLFFLAVFAFLFPALDYFLWSYLVKFED